MLGDGAHELAFPFVRRRGPVAFVLLSTAEPSLPLLATGRLGELQLEAIGRILAELGQQDVCRVVALHHPPEDHPTRPRKALRDRAALRAVIARHGAELVLHGHQHHSHFGLIDGPRGKVPVLGVPSASMVCNPPKGDEARWNLFEVRREGTGWTLSLHVRRLSARGFETFGRWWLKIPGS